MTIELEKDVALNLVQFRLKHIKKTISEILETWGEKYPEEFLDKARTGTLPESEMDAISMEQLMSDLEKFQNLHHSLSHSG